MNGPAYPDGWSRAISISQVLTYCCHCNVNWSVASLLQSLPLTFERAERGRWEQASTTSSDSPERRRVGASCAVLPASVHRIARARVVVPPNCRSCTFFSPSPIVTVTDVGTICSSRAAFCQSSGSTSVTTPSR